MKDRDETCAEFRRSAVNMDADELEQEAQKAMHTHTGQHNYYDIAPNLRETESQGHMSGRRVLELLKKDDSQLTDDDVDHMRKVISYVKRHTAQRPNKSEQELEHSRWTSSLRNWGHDPMKQPDHEYAEHEGAEGRSG
ncbi:hypothetical protein QJQ45_017630 [Haematococcus lacustris]|nr:hypothetical protein QJQ45_017630 [Haematococcus lacustris]